MTDREKFLQDLEDGATILFKDSLTIGMFRILNKIITLMEEARDAHHNITGEELNHLVGRVKARLYK